MKKFYKAIIFLILVLAVFSSFGCVVVEGPGKSAYEIAVENGFIGSEKAWLESLKGKDGKDGKDGVNGKDGIDGKDGEIANAGKSAYEIAVENGFVGTEQEWLESLKGEDVYEIWYNALVAEGYEGSFTDFMNEYIKGTGSSDNSGVQNDSEEIINRLLLSAVEVYSETTVSNYGVKTKQYSSGAGVVYKGNKQTGEAYIITNHHVIYDGGSSDRMSDNVYVYFYGMLKTTAPGAEVTIANMVSYSGIKAEVIGGSITGDIAVLKITSDIYKTEPYMPIEVGSGNKVSVGETAIAIGNPKSEGMSATMGIVSVVSEVIDLLVADDSVTISPRVLRVDTAINSGNSGGGLFDGDGKLIGIVNAKTTSNNTDNMAYAIPSDVAIGIANNLINRYESSAHPDDMVKTKGYGYMKCLVGIVTEATSSTAVYNEETKRTDIVQTITITEITEGSSADGVLQLGDVIKTATLNGKTITVVRYFEVSDLLLDAKQGDVLTLVVAREENGKTVLKTIEISLQNLNYVE